MCVCVCKCVIIYLTGPPWLTIRYFQLFNVLSNSDKHPQVPVLEGPVQWEQCRETAFPWPGRKLLPTHSLGRLVLWVSRSQKKSPHKAKGPLGNWLVWVKKIQSLGYWSGRVSAYERLDCPCFLQVKGCLFMWERPSVEVKQLRVLWPLSLSQAVSDASFPWRPPSYCHSWTWLLPCARFCYKPQSQWYPCSSK